MTDGPWCESVYEEQVSLIKEMAAIPSPSHHEEKRAAFILSWLKRRGVRQAYVDEALNVCVPMGTEGGGAVRVYAAHTDTVFSDTQPIPVTEDSERICAPGVGDDTANVAAIMLIIRYVVEKGLRPAVPVLFVFNTCEEGLGNLKGVKTIARDWTGRIGRFVSFDGQTDKIVDRAVGSVRWKVAVRAEGGHSFGKFGNQSAIHQIAKIIADLYSLDVPDKEGTRTTYNVGTLSGGTSVNSIAESAEMSCEVRSDDEGCLQLMKDRFLAVLASYSQAGLDVKSEMIGERPCMGNVDRQKQEALLEQCSDIIRQYSGSMPERGSSSTDANIPLSLGIPSTCFGLYLGGRSHTRDEWILKSSLTPGLKIGLHAVLTDFMD